MLNLFGYLNMLKINIVKIQLKMLLHKLFYYKFQTTCDIFILNEPISYTHYKYFKNKIFVSAFYFKSAISLSLSDLMLLDILLTKFCLIHGALFEQSHSSQHQLRKILIVVSLVIWDYLLNFSEKRYWIGCYNVSKAPTKWFSLGC